MSIHEKRPAIDFLLNPKEMPFSRILASETVESYLDKCQQNIRAELWELFRAKVNPSFRNWKETLLRPVFLDIHADNKVASAYHDELMSQSMDLQELSWNLVVSGNRVCLLQSFSDDFGNAGLKLLLGRQISGRFAYEKDTLHGRGVLSSVHVIGFVGTFLAELEAIQKLREQHVVAACKPQTKQEPSKTGANHLLMDVVSPGTRQSDFWNKAGKIDFNEAISSNSAQRDIIQGLHSNIECIQGPPGTGKSTTIYHILSARLPADASALVTCVQNKAIDSICEKLALSVKQVPFVVHGNPSRLGENAVRFTADAQAARDPVVLQINELCRARESCLEFLNARFEMVLRRWCSGKRLWKRWWYAYARVKNAALLADVRHYENLLTSSQDRAREAFSFAQENVVLNARAVLSTIDSLGTLSMDTSKRIVVIIDEAGTVPEFKIPLLIQKGAQAIVAIGDQNQLQPFTNSRDDDVQDGFFQRVVRALGDVAMLSIQYRMHPEICQVVSNLFYGGLLTTCPAISRIRCMDSRAPPIQWLDYPDMCAESSDRKKRFNEIEIDLISGYMHDSLASLLEQGKSVFILTFYKEQLKLLMEQADNAGFLFSDQEMTALRKKNKLGEKPLRFRHANFRIMTVDAAQGSEADIVLISCVRCNARGDIGFVSNPNRACVALSRAKEQLIVVGSARTMTRDRHWMAVKQAAVLM